MKSVAKSATIFCAHFFSNVVVTWATFEGIGSIVFAYHVKHIMGKRSYSFQGVSFSSEAHPFRWTI